MHSISFVVEDPVPVLVRISGNLDGTLSYELTLLGAGRIADLDAVFIDLNGSPDGDGFRVFGDAGLTLGPCVAEGTDTLGRVARLSCPAVDTLGDFDVAVRFGPDTPAAMMARSTGFTLAHETATLTLEMIDLADIGLRFATPVADGTVPDDVQTTAGDIALLTEPEELALVDGRAAQARILSTDSRGGVVAVIDLRGARDSGSVFAGGIELLESEILAGARRASGTALLGGRA